VPTDEPRDLDAQLLERRTVLLWGPLDDERAGLAAARLMWLDGSGDAAVELHLDSSGGPLHAAFTLIDTIDLLGVPVHAHCRGRVEGSAIGVLAACDFRAAAPHAQFHLIEPPSEVSGRAADLAQWADHHQRELAQFVARLSATTGRPQEHLEADLANGRWMDATTAVEYGLVQEVTTPRRGPASPPRPGMMGFRPPPG